MSLFLSRLRIGVRRSSSVSLLLFNGFSTSLRQSPPGFVIAARLTVCYANQRGLTDLDKRVPMNLVYPHIHNDDKTQNDRGISWVDSYSKGRRHPSSPR
ncbi:BnaCnng07630D [Brassica napus]|uniref:(rape) hypothetical protein n=1 Tax=Brassica napus TaxID=3708 RepID=A0A078HFX9_BRANA|nr:unnamed protein product [Brassica napus]CDY36661.1 BnaCnng07630D [Brassica napus]